MHTIIIILLSSWVLIDIFRYLRYMIMYRRFNNKKYSTIMKHSNIKKLLCDLRKYPDFFEDVLHSIYFCKVSLENMNFVDVCNAIYDFIDNDPQYINDIKVLIKEHQIRERKMNKRIIFQSQAIHPRLRDQNHNLKSWFDLFPFYLLTQIINIIVCMYMFIIGYRYKISKNRVRIWFSKYDEKKGTPLIFFHASVGGVAVLLFLLRYYYKNYNID